MLPLRVGSPGGGTRGWSLSRMVRRFVRKRQQFNLFALFKLLVVIGAVATGLLYYISLDWPVIIEDSKYGILGSIDSSRFTLDRMCSQTTNSCFVVFDSVDFKKNIAMRNLAVEGFDETVDAMVRLKPPKGMKVSESDTRMWAVDHGVVPIAYANVMAVAPFVTSSLDAAKGVSLEAKVLCIGLGGGSIDMFLATKFPKVEVTGVEVDPVVVTLARKWFYISGRENHNVQIMNGAQYLTDTEKRFDAVLIDACGVDLVMPCPTNDFLDDALVAVLSSRVLLPSGTLAVNIFPMSDKSSNRRVEVVLKLFKRYFANCFTVSLEDDNLVLICLNKQLPSKDSSKLYEQFYDMWQQLQLERGPTIKRVAFYL